MYVYKITNAINGKVYIGQTIRQINDRFKRHIHDAENNILNTHLARAIRKYGADNFRIEQIDIAENQEELTQKEYMWIEKYNSTDSDFGYNETNDMNKCGGNTYQNKSEEELASIGDKISKTKIGANNPNAKPVKCLNVDTQEELFFDTVLECQKYFGEQTHRFITTRTNGQTRGLYKNSWAIAYIDRDYQYERIVHKTGRRIKLIDLTSGHEHTFASIRLACRELSIPGYKIAKHIHDGEHEFIEGNYRIVVF